ncbi:MAG: C4-dicarboxylate ABC transporter permease [Deltaproteobacteria bacterium]|jgi:TRAP-type mannitol/chloroaromatic compound transport system permease small subunit|nr:C4-dicarboxylate ABC transporter permease [Deltaproteobacteria bacterium]
MRTALGRFADLVDALSTRVGGAAAWLYPVLVAVLVVNVGLRYGLGRGFIELEELQWHLYAAAFLLGFAYTYATDEHVRVDLLHARLSPRTRAWIELLGCVLLLLPFASIVSIWAFDFFLSSWQLGERSPMPSGLPARWIIKLVLFLAMVLLSLQALGTAARNLLVVWPPRAGEQGEG